MGYFVKGEYIYILGKIIEVNPEDSRKYRVKTNLANFYVTETGDTLASNPAEVYTASEMYALMQNIAKMSDEDLHICFGDEVNDLTEVVLHGWSITELRTMYLEWEFGNKVTVGDMVYYTPESAEPETPAIICAVISINRGTYGEDDTPGSTANDKYLLYDDENEATYLATRAEITSAHRRSSGVINALSNLDQAVQKAREEIG